VELRNRVMERTVLQASQICHHPRLYGKKETHLCRGARDEQLTILHRLGWLPEATDKAFEIASRRVLGNAGRQTKERRDTGGGR
jgi:hypothetical protein